MKFLKDLVVAVKGKYKGLVFIGVLALISCKGEDKPRVEVLKNNPYVDIIKNPLSAQSQLDSSETAKVSFDESIFSFDTITEGKIVEHTFRFTNTGKNPLSIFDARSTCGCTVAEYTKEIIGTGQEGIVKVSFDTKNKTGQQNKPVTLYANTLPQKTVVRLKGFVKSHN